MIRGHLRKAACAGAAVVLGTAAALAQAAPVFSQEGECRGVIVVVDFGDAAVDQVESVVGCAEDDPASGLEALTQAGFSVTEVASFPGLVCRIDDVPDTECGAAPPADRSWSYWHADDTDAEWTFASVGAGVRDPGGGDVEGWTFGDSSSGPSIAPDQAFPSDPPAETDADQSLTWVIAVVILAAIAGLIIWRLRGRRQA